MSQLKKQSIVSRKANRAPAKRKPGRTSSHSFVFLRLISRGAIGVSSLVFKPFKNLNGRWPISALIVAGGVTGLGLAAYGTATAVKSITEKVPERLEVRCLRIDLRDKISEISSDTLNEAQNSSWNRTALMNKLLSRISKLDGVDEVRIRAGLDRKVIVDVTAQTPFLVMQGKGSERILIGDQFKIIARGLPKNSYDHLPQLEIPELNLNLTSSRETSETRSGYFVRPSINAGVNVRWLGQQTINIYSLFESQRIPLKVQMVSWKSVSGFNVLVEEHSIHNQKVASNIGLQSIGISQNPSTNTPNTPHQYNVVLGEKDFSEKFTRLKQVIDDLRTKKTVVDQIDLGFADKAIIRVNEQLSEAKRGGL